MTTIKENVTEKKKKLKKLDFLASIKLTTITEWG